jgi:ribosomal protein L29
MRMTTDDIRKMTVDEIKKELTSQYLELRNISDLIRSGKEKNVSKNLNIKRNIARMLTVLRQKQTA